MITEDYVSFETAKLLKEKGYWNVSTVFYKENGELIRYKVPLNNKGISDTLGVFYEAPTLQMAMKWLREEKNLHLDIAAESFDEDVLYRVQTIFRSGKNHRWFGFEPQDDSDGFYKTYEEACNAAVKYCLEKLI